MNEKDMAVDVLMRELGETVSALGNERAKCRETAEALTAEREAHESTKRVVLGMMSAIDAHLGQLRAALERR